MEEEEVEDVHTGGELVEENKPLRIGDYVILKGISIDGYMAGEGILEDDLCLQKVPPRFDDCVFQIFPDQQYSAARELAHFKETASVSLLEEESVGGDDDDEEEADDAVSPEAKFKKMLRSLERAHDSERDMNKKQFEQYLGNQLKFGAKIQLLHRKSQKFLTVNKGVTAKHETENLKVYLDKDGSEYSWFNASPFFGIDRDGNDMESNAKVKLIVNARESEGSQIHIAESTFTKSSKDREVNCSINPTGWQMSLYSEFFKKGDPDLCAGEIVQLHDPEGDNYLRLKEVADEARVDAYLQSNKVGVIKTNTNFLWMIERHKNPAAGGKLAYGADANNTFRLRHLNTGKYLCCRSKDRWNKGRKVLAAIVNRGSISPTSQEEFVFASIDQGRRKECGLFFHSANPYVAAKTGGVGAAAVYIQDNAAIQIQSASSDRYLHISDKMLEDDGTSPTFRTLAIVDKINPTTSVEFNMCLRRFEVSDAQLTDIMVGVAGLPFLKNYSKLLEKHTMHSQIYDDQALKGFKKVLQQFILFLAHMPMTINDNQGIKYEDIDEKMAVLTSADMEFRQQLLQEQGVVTTVVTILEQLNSERTLDIAQSGASETGGKQKRKAKGLAEFETLRKDIACASLRLLYLAILDNPESQMDLADYLGTLIGYVPIEEYATECIVHMLSSNQELQESKVKTKDIEFFIKMIRDNPLSASYLELLRSVCSCGGNGIDANQGRVVDMWLDDAEDLSMKLALDKRSGKSNTSMVMHTDPARNMWEEHIINGCELLENGLPNLTLSWESPIASLTVSAIMPGREDGVPLEMLFDASGDNRKKRICDYFIAQMYLAAETCLDRNYCAMEKCAEQFPYPWLVGIMKHPNLPQKLKAACTRLVNTLYVDRGPQVLLRVPRLSYAMNEIADTAKLASCAEGDDYKFFLLTDIISQNINGLKDSGWDQYTRQQMALLLQLVRFNFYNNKDKIMVITDPLIRALDCRDQDASKMLAGEKTMEFTQKIEVQVVGDEKGSPAQGSGEKVFPEGVVAPYQPWKGCGWEAKMWWILDSIPWLVIILLFVIVGVTLSICQELNVSMNENSVQIFEYIASATFFLDLVFKLWCFTFVEKVPASHIYKFVINKGKPDWLNIIDVVVVLIDVFMYAVAPPWEETDEDGGSAGSFAKAGRMARLVRLTRILKAARLVNKITEDVIEEEEPDWEKPARYRTTPKNQLDTMLQMIRILAEVGDLTRDYTLGLTLSELKKVNFLADAVLRSDAEEVKEMDNTISQDELGGAVELYQRCQHLGEEMALQSASDGDGEEDAPIDNVFLDICLYEHGELVQSALNVLMNHHSSRQFLLTDLISTQLLSDADPKATAEFDTLRRYILELRNMAEEQELWGELESDKDYEQSDRMKMLLRYVTEACYQRTKMVNFYSAYVPIKAKQDMLRNLGGFETAMTILALHESIEDPDEDADEDEKNKKEEVNANTLDILRLCNIFLSWFISGNSENQEMANDELETFMDTLEDEIGSGLVIAAIIRGNSELIRQIPLVLISETTDRIVNQGFNPEYLSILEAMVYLEDFDGANNVDVQSEICKNLTRQGRVDKTLYLCQDTEGDDYAERMGLMSEAQSRMMKMDPMGNTNKGQAKDITIDEDVKHLDSKLKYHCRLLDVLAGCAIGRLNVTTVETKLQALYSPDQCLMALLDDKTSLDVAGPLAAFFFHAVVEVEIAVTGMMQNMLMWEFLERIPKQLSAAASILNNQFPNSDYSMACADGPIGIKSRQQLVYTWFCIRIYTKFFEEYYQPSLRNTELADDLRQSPSSNRYYANQVSRGAEAASDPAYADQAAFAEPSAELDADAALDMSSVDSGGDDATLGLDSEEEEEEDEEDAETHWIDELIEKLHSSTMKIFQNYRHLLNVSDQKVLDEAIHALRSRLATLEGVVPLIAAGHNEEKDEFQEKLDAFTDVLADDEDLAVIISRDRTKIAKSINELPKIRDFEVIADLRFEPLVESLVEHVLSRLETDGTKKSLDPECTKTTIWLVQVFRRMIEDAWGMTIDERDDDGGEEEDEKSADIVAILDKRGVTCLCLDLIAVGIDTELILECVNLCVALLFKEGGATMVQETMNNHLMSTPSELFFRQVKNEISSIKRFYEYEDIPPSAGAECLRVLLEKQAGDEDADPVTPANIRVLRFLQLMSEGHFEKNQDLMRVQGGAGKPINLLYEFVDLLNALSKKKSRAATAAAMATSDVILEVIQGPCRENQDYFARSTELIEIMMRVLRDTPKGDCEQEEDDEVKKCLLEVFEGLTEGQGKPSEVFDKILSVLDLDVLALLIQTGDGGDELTEIQIEGLVLLQMFMDYDPEIAPQVRLPRRIRNQMNKEVISVEVVWNGKLQRRFFPVPPICAHIAEATKDNLVEFVNRESQDSKLQDFISRAQDIYREVQHQQNLADTSLEVVGCGLTSYFGRFNLAQIFSRTNQENITWGSFACALTINVIFLFTLQHKKGWVPGMGPTKKYKEGGFYSTYSTDPAANFNAKGDLLTTDMYRVRGDEEIYFGEYDDVWKVIVEILNIANILFSFFTLILFLVVRCPVKYRKLSETKDKIWAFLLTCTDTMTLYYFFYTIVAFVSYRYDSAVHPFLLMDIIVKNSTTADVVKAVVFPIKQLAAAALLGVFVIYIFAMITFKNFASDFRYDGGDDAFGKPGFDDFMPQADAEHLNEDCRTLFGCFKVSANYGMRLSGGTGDIMTHSLEGNRLILDLLYFLIVLVVLLNVIFGIIIDTFSELRQQKLDKRKDKTGFCFICGIPAQTFEQASSEPGPFKRHIKSDHYMWSYLSFILFIWEQDKDDDDGLELYVRKLLEKEEITWFPVGSALCLSTNDKEEETTAEHLDRVSGDLQSVLDEASDKQLKTIGEVNMSLSHTVSRIHELLVKADSERNPAKSDDQVADDGAAALVRNSRK